MEFGLTGPRAEESNHVRMRAESQIPLQRSLANRESLSRVSSIPLSFYSKVLTEKLCFEGRVLFFQ